jgi:hypothetical protein
MTKADNRAAAKAFREQQDQKPREEARARAVAADLEPIRGPDPIGRGREVVTLGDAAVYIQKPPKAQHRLQHRQDAVDHLIRAAEGSRPQARLRSRIRQLWPLMGFSLRDRLATL